MNEQVNQLELSEQTDQKKADPLDQLAQTDPLTKLNSIRDDGRRHGLRQIHN